MMIPTRLSPERRLALVSLGFAPAFIARTREAARHSQAQDSGRDLPARRRGRPEHGRAVRRSATTTEPPVDRDSAPGIGASGALDLDGFFGFHPRMAPLEPLFERGELAIVHACGSPDDTRSHFDAQDYMESGTPGVKSTRDGWLNRVPARRSTHERPVPFRAVALAPQLPRTLQGTAPALAIGQLGQFGVRAGNARHDGDVVRGAVRAAGRLRCCGRPAAKRSTP